MIRRATDYFLANRRRLLPFVVIGGTAFLVNWGLFWLLRMAGMTSRLEVYLALILSIEISILYNFTLQYRWTWVDSPRVRGRRLLGRIATFHGAVGAGVLVRLALFPVGQLLRVHDDLNFIAGVAAATLIDFVLYDKVVFR